MNKVKTQRDAKRLQNLRKRPAGTAEVMNRRTPARTVNNVWHGRIVKGIRDISRIARQPWEEDVAEALRNLEIQRYQRANSYFDAINRAQNLMVGIRQRGAELQITVEELQSTNEELESTNEELQSTNEELEATTDELERTSAYLQGLMDGMVDLVIATDTAGLITEVNQAAQELSGYDRDELIGEKFEQFFTDPEGAREALAQVLVEAKISDWELILATREGGEVPVSYNATVLKGADGVVTGTLGSARDITERLLAEEELRQASIYNRSLIEASLDPLVTIDPEGRITDVNSATEQVTGRTREELIGTDFSDYFTEPELARAGYQQAFREGSVQDYALELRHQNGRVAPVLYNASVYHDQSGEVVGVFAAARDITEQRAAQQELERASLYNRSLIEASLDPLVTIDPDGRITDVNSATEQVTGLKRAELIGTDFSDYFTEPELARAGYQQVFRDGSVQDYPLELRHRNGRVAPVLYNASVYRDEKGDVVGVFAAARDIAEQRAAQQELERASAYNRSLIEASLDPLVTIDPAGRITDVNHATEEVVGLARAELIGTDFSDYFTEPELARKGYIQAFLDGSVQDYALELRHRDGLVTPVLYNASVYRDGEGEVVGVFAAARDITEQKKAEDAHGRLASIVESSDDAIVGKALDGTITSWNYGARNLYGYSAKEIVGQHFKELVPEDHHDEVDEFLAKIRDGNPIDHYETVRQRKDGSQVDVSVKISPIKGADGHIIGASSIARDITEQRAAQQELERASLYNRSLIEASLDPLVTIDPDGRITDVNSATEQVTGLMRAELIGTDFSDYFTEPELARAGYQQVFRDGSVQDYPLELRHRSGRVAPVLYNASVYRDEKGNVVGVFAAARDITEQRAAQQELERASLYNRSLIEASLDPLVTIDPDGRITDVNSATEQVTGLVRAELIGTDFSDYFTEPELARAGYQQVFRDGSVQDYPLELRHRNGLVTPVLYNASVYRDETGEVIGMFAAARNIAETKRTTEELSRSNSELEQFAYVASHDLQEPLRKIESFGNLLQEELGDKLGEEGDQYISWMQEAAVRMRSLIEALLTYSRVTRVKTLMAKVDLNEVAVGVVNDLQVVIEEVGGQVELGELPAVKADPTQMRQLLQNIIGNALKFHRADAAPIVKVSSRLLQPNEFRPKEFTSEQRLWEISIADNGIGFDEQYLDKVFTPFQRLHGREDFDGSGIGLAVCRKIVTHHGGTITARSVIGQGSQFIITIPESVDFAKENIQ